MIEIVVNPGVVCVIVGLVDAVLNQRTDFEFFSEVLTEPRTVVAPVSGEDLQLARVPAGELLADIGVTPLSRGRAVQIEDDIHLCIDQFRRFEVLDLVFRLGTVRAARRRPLGKTSRQLLQSVRCREASQTVGEAFSRPPSQFYRMRDITWTDAGDRP